MHEALQASVRFVLGQNPSTAFWIACLLEAWTMDGSLDQNADSGLPGPVADGFDPVHELRTHLMVIALAGGNLDLLYDRLDDDQRRRMIRNIRQSSQALNSLLRAGLLGC
jgi:hypothetical protein